MTDEPTTQGPGPDDTGDEADGPTASGPSIPAELVDAAAHPVAPLDDSDDDPFDLGDLLGGGGLDMGNLLAQAQQMQQQLAAAQEEAAQEEVEGVAGGGAVRITVTGGGEFRSVAIDPGAVDPEDVTMLEDLVLAALRDATDQVRELQSGAMGDLGGLGGLLGGG